MSKVDPIRDLLEDASGIVEMPISELSEIVPGGLPRSACVHGLWWTNRDPSHSQSRAWGVAGYDAEPDIKREMVRFVPTGNLRR